MPQKIRVLLGVAGFAVFIVIALAAYNSLEGRVNPYDNLDLSQNQGSDRTPAQENETGFEADSAGDPEPDSGANMAPDFAMADADGNSVTLHSLLADGKPAVLNFWASWCPPCRSEMPGFEKAFKEFGGEVRFVMVDLVDGGRETKEKGAKYVEDEGYTFPVFFDIDQEGAYAYGIRSIPTTFFLDKNGGVVTSAQGALDESALRKGIESIL